jgi:hypothetical protein
MVMVSPSHVIYLPILRSTVITRFIATTVGSATHRTILSCLCFKLASQYSLPWKSPMGFPGCVINLYKLASV